jgi:hypothetical protein
MTRNEPTATTSMTREEMALQQLFKQMFQQMIQLMRGTKQS